MRHQYNNESNVLVSSTSSFYKHLRLMFVNAFLPLWFLFSVSFDDALKKVLPRICAILNSKSPQVKLLQLKMKMSFSTVEQSEKFPDLGTFT